MAKLGALVLADGTRDGQRIISEAWVGESTRAHARVRGTTRYGYQWWRERQPVRLHNEEAYFAAGFGGQMIFVLPGLDAVVVIANEMSDENAGAASVQALMQDHILPAMVGTTASDAVLWVWYGLTAVSLLAIVVLSTRDGAPSAGRLVPWVLVVCSLGLVGLLLYLSWRRWGRPRSLCASAYAATGSAVGLVILTLVHRALVDVNPTLSLPPAVVVLPLLPVALLAGWLLFRAPQIGARFSVRYVRALKQTLFAEILSTAVVAAGMVLPVLLLMLRWFPREVDLASPLFWPTVSAATIADTALAWSLEAWMLSRGYDMWPWPAELAPGATDSGPSLPSLRRDWWILLTTSAVYAFGMVQVFSGPG